MNESITGFAETLKKNITVNILNRKTYEEKKYDNNFLKNLKI